MALAADLNTEVREGPVRGYPVKAGMKIFSGALVAAVAGMASPGAAGTNLVALGRAEEQVDNTAGADGAATVRVRRGVFVYACPASGPDAIDATCVGRIAYIVDDQTIGLTSNGGTRSPAGIIEAVDADGVWVVVGLGPWPVQAGALVATNNLGDVTSPAVARANLGANKVVVAGFVGSLSVASTLCLVAPVAGTIEKLWSVIQGALATGNAVLTASINGTPITGGVVTNVQAGSAAGDIASATPTALHIVAAGDKIAIVVSGTNSASVSATIQIEIDT
jgi:hypothetical protein